MTVTPTSIQKNRTNTNPTNIDTETKTNINQCLSIPMIKQTLTPTPHLNRHMTITPIGPTSIQKPTPIFNITYSKVLKRKLG
ncbi:hypothetical protein M8J76_016028 [Diaphorina citri]|nr:hypothetical protein M8J76_016028 [Diaphorina citri]